VADLAEALFTGYAAYLAAYQIVRHPESEAVLREMIAQVPIPGRLPIGLIPRKDGWPAAFEVPSFLREAQERENFRDDYERAWLVGALLTLNDRLEAEGHFDKAPVIELVRHLRNGVAHGNRFYLRGDEPKLPADLMGDFQITKALNGQPVLFDFMESGDVFVALIAVRDHLRDLASRPVP
jgi:hypothetical protein